MLQWQSKILINYILINADWETLAFYLKKVVFSLFMTLTCDISVYNGCFYVSKVQPPVDTAIHYVSSSLDSTQASYVTVWKGSVSKYPY